MYLVTANGKEITEVDDRGETVTFKPTVTIIETTDKETAHKAYQWAIDGGLENVTICNDENPELPADPFLAFAAAYLKNVPNGAK